MSLTQSGNSLWDCPEIETQVKSYGTTNQASTLVSAEFLLLEGQYSASFKRDSNSRGGKVNGDYLKGNWMKVKLRNQSTDELVTLEVAMIKINNSQLNLV